MDSYVFSSYNHFLTIHHLPRSGDWLQRLGLLSIMKIRTTSLLLGCMLWVMVAQAQKSFMVTEKAPPVTCNPFNQRAMRVDPTLVAAQRDRMISAARVQAPKARFKVQYNNFPPAAEKAFQAAVDVWATILESDVEIIVEANWLRLGTGVLGSASPTSIHRDFPGAVKARTWYPTALAEKMARRNLNGTESDIVANFSSVFNWYTGLSGVPGNNQQDLFTIVLHELGHGLGFYGSTRVNSSLTQGFYGNNGLPFIFDTFIVGTNGRPLTDITAFPNPSANLLRQYTSTNLTYSSPSILKVNNGEPAKLYTPTEWDNGSSVSHLDEQTYPPRNENTLMTPFAGSQEVTQDPGPITRAMFIDMGWKSSAILHVPLEDTEDLTKAQVFTAQYAGDTTLKANTLKLFISTTGRTSDATEVALTAGANNTYSYTLPTSTRDRQLTYYFTGEDNANRKLFTPAEAPRFFYQFTVGADTVKPQLLYTNPVNFVFPQSRIQVGAQALDNIGIEKVTLEYSVDGRAQQPIELPLLAGSTTAYLTLFDLTTLNLRGGERIRYRIVATDKSKNKNQRILPATGTYEWTVLNVQAPINQYSTDFSTQNVLTDFYFDKMSIQTPAGFAGASLNSEHPYADGTQYFIDGNGYSDYTALLLKPITIKAQKDSATITFDEIALIEPGEPNTVYTDPSFYDYVVVEGSVDGGKTWKVFADGWDARDDARWLTTWNRSTDAGQNSTSVATSDLFKRRTLNLIDKTGFKAGDQVLIRFRLTADESAFGWGWCIDNLFIQSRPAAPVVVTSTEPLAEVGELLVTPNPTTTGEFEMEARFVKPTNKVRVKLFRQNGQPVFDQDFESSGTTFRQRISTGALSTGFYLIEVQAGDNGKIVKRVGVVK
jgi:hypothetical protein